MKNSTPFAEILQKSFKKGLTKFFCWCIMQSVKATTLFTFRNLKNNFIYEEGKDVFNVVGDKPTVKGVFSFFIKEEAVCHM